MGERLTIGMACPTCNDARAMVTTTAVGQAAIVEKVDCPTCEPILCRHCGGEIRQIEVVDFTNGARRRLEWVHITPVHLGSSALCPRMYAAPAVAE